MTTLMADAQGAQAQTQPAVVEVAQSEATQSQAQTQQASAGGWSDSFSADLKDIVSKNGFTNPEAVVKAYGSLQTMLGADKVLAPSKDGTWPEDSLLKLGVPKDGAYKIERP